MEERWTLVVRLLRDVVDERVTSEEAMRRLQELSDEMRGRHFGAAWAQIQHYGDDADIREREPAYGKKQRKDMKDLANKIERTMSR